MEEATEYVVNGNSPTQFTTIETFELSSPAFVEIHSALQRRGNKMLVLFQVGSSFFWRGRWDEIDKLMDALAKFKTPDESTFEAIQTRLADVLEDVQEFKDELNARELERKQNMETLARAQCELWKFPPPRNPDAETASHENVIDGNGRFFEGVVNALIVSGLIAVCVVAWLLYGY